MILMFRRTRCPQCKAKLEQGQRIHPECIDAYAEAQEAKAQRKAEKERKALEAQGRREIRERKAAMKTVRQLIKEAQIEFNAFIRYRDRDRLCICCGHPLGGGPVGGDYDCGHYRSTGSAPHLRFDERNAHAQRKVCNRWGAGRAVDYRRGLLERIGVEGVEALESDNTPHKWERDELIAIRDKYRQKLKQLKEDQ